MKDQNGLRAVLELSTKISRFPLVALLSEAKMGLGMRGGKVKTQSQEDGEASSFLLTETAVGWKISDDGLYVADC